MNMIRIASSLLLGLTLVVGAAAEEKLLLGNGTQAELIDLNTLTTLAATPVGPGDTRAVAVSHDRRYALVSQDAGGRGPGSGAIAVLDLTQSAMPVVAWIGPSFLVKDLVVSPDGKRALAAGFTGFTPEVLFIDMTSSPPQGVKSVSLPGQSAFGVAVTPDGKTGYVADTNGSRVIVLDLSSFPSVSTRIVPLASPWMASVSNDGRRLLVPFMGTMVSVWDLASPVQPTRLSDVALPTPTVFPKPAFEPGNGFAVLPAQNPAAPGIDDFHVIDAHANPPRRLGGIELIQVQGQALLGTPTVTSDGLTCIALLGTPSSAQLLEIDLMQPAKPALTSRRVLKLGPLGQILAFGEVHAPGPTSIGASRPVHFSSPNDAGKPYLLAASLATRPGIPVGGRRIPLVPDALFGASVTLPAVFQKFQGVLDGNGQATAVIRVPGASGLRGLSFYVAGVVVDPAKPLGIGTISNAVHLVAR